MKRTWISVNDEPVPFDCDVVICYKGWVRLDEDWKRGLRVSLARAWITVPEVGRIIQRESSFFCWPDRELVPYSEIIYWMPFEGFPEPPAE